MAAGVRGCFIVKQAIVFPGRPHVHISRSYRTWPQSINKCTLFCVTLDPVHLLCVYIVYTVSLSSFFTSHICISVLLPAHWSFGLSFLTACLPVSDSTCGGIHLAGNSLSWLAVFLPDGREAESWRIRKQLLSCLSPAFCSQLPTLLLRRDAETEREKDGGGGQR